MDFAAPTLPFTPLDGFDSIDGRMRTLPIYDQWPDAYSIVAHLQNLSDHFGRVPDVRLYAAAILPTDIGDNNVRAQISSLTSWVKRNVKYTADPLGTEYVKSPLVMLDEIQRLGIARGDCDDHVLLFNSLLRSLGIETRVIGVKLYARDRFDHVISSVFDGERWRDIDLCAKTAPQPHYLERLLASES